MNNIKEIMKTVRPAWIEIDLAQIEKNFEIISKDKPAQLKFIAVVKDQATGHGAVEVGKIGLKFDAVYLAVATINEALEIRKNIPEAPVMILGERTDEELELCLGNNFTCFINDIEKADKYAKLAESANKRPVVHVKVDTGLNRYGVRHTKAIDVINYISKMKQLDLEGVMSHFAMSDELDKSFALTQLERFENILNEMENRGIKVKYRHICNSGGFLDLPQAHLDMVRFGVLPLGVYPSLVCRRIPGLEPTMSVKCKIAAIRDIEVGDYVGYSMHYRAESPRRIAVLPIGYGDGYPRVRNKGGVLIHGKRAPIIGGNAMDAMMVDITDIPETLVWDEVVLLGKQNGQEIDAREIAQLKGSVFCDVLAGWNSRLPRVYKL